MNNDVRIENKSEFRLPNEQEVRDMIISDLNFKKIFKTISTAEYRCLKGNSKMSNKIGFENLMNWYKRNFPDDYETFKHYIETEYWFSKYKMHVQFTEPVKRTIIEINMKK